MSKSAEEKRWAIVPPASPTSTALSGEFSLEAASKRKSFVRQLEAEPLLYSELASSFSRELEPADSERVTEVPPYSHDRALRRPAGLSDPALETIPAPEWFDIDD